MLRVFFAMSEKKFSQSPNIMCPFWRATPSYGGLFYDIYSYLEPLGHNHHFGPFCGCFFCNFWKKSCNVPIVCAHFEELPQLRGGGGFMTFIHISNCWATIAMHSFFWTHLHIPLPLHLPNAFHEFAYIVGKPSERDACPSLARENYAPYGASIYNS